MKKEMIVHGGGLFIFLWVHAGKYFLTWASGSGSGRYDGDYSTREDAVKAAYRYVQY